MGQSVRLVVTTLPVLKLCAGWREEEKLHDKGKTGPGAQVFFPGTQLKEEILMEILKDPVAGEGV